MELCCDNACFAAALRRRGFDVLGVDKPKGRVRPMVPGLFADLATAEGRNLVEDLCLSTHLFYVHITPPGSTTCRARERPPPDSWGFKNSNEIRPLRSALFPAGLPYLKGDEIRQVQEANYLFDYIAELIPRLQRRGILWSLQNAKSSWFWLYPEIKNHILAMPECNCTDYAACMWGGDRPSVGRLVSNCAHFRTLAIDCDGKHQHANFISAKMAQGPLTVASSNKSLPKNLCDEMAQRLVLQAKDAGVIQENLELADASLDFEVQRKQLKASAGKFVRGQLLPPIIAEFKTFVEMPIAAGTKVGTNFSKDEVHYKVVRLLDSGDDRANKAVCGVFRSPEEFIQQARCIKHPVDLNTPIPDSVKKTLFWMLTTAPDEVAKSRLQKIQMMRKFVQNFELVTEVNKEKHRSANHTIILKSKRLKLLKHILNEIHYPDLDIASDIAEGMPVVGRLKKSNIFPYKLTQASMHVSDLKLHAQTLRKGLLEKIANPRYRDETIDKAVWDETVEECDKDWLSGPFTEQQLETLLGDNFLVARRFGLQQGPKIRTIDDYSENGVNSTVSCSDKLDLHTVDDYVGLLKLACNAVDSQGRVCIPLNTGEIMHGHIPKGHSVDSFRNWFGKTYDLKAAYRQIPNRESEHWCCVIAVYCPTSRTTKLFLQHTLAFGQVGAVYGFNRAARAIWAALTTFIRVLSLNFYDDFPAAELEKNIKTADLVFKAFFILTGWDLSLSKDKPFAKTFVMLGVTMNLTETTTCVLQVENKPERIANIVESLRAVQLAGKMSSGETAIIKGKLQFASYQIHGRVALQVIRLLNLHQFATKNQTLSSDLLAAIDQVIIYLTVGGPRRLDFMGDQHPILIFTDGACEGENFSSVSIGSVILDTRTMTAVMFGFLAPSNLVQSWKSEGREQTIGQAELLPVLLSRIYLQGACRNRRLIFCIDNDSARFSLIRGSSPNLASQLIIHELNKLECHEQTWTWFARVPTASNPGDGPSRLNLVPGPSNHFARVVAAPQIPPSIFLPQTIGLKVGLPRKRKWGDRQVAAKLT